MATGVEAVRLFKQGAGDGEYVVPAAAAPPPVFLPTGKDRPVDPMIWGDEERMKRELMAWAKAVASIALNGSGCSASTPPSMGHRRKCMS